MRKLFNIDQEEKNRILEMHVSATKRHYLNEYNGVAFGDEQNGLKIEKVETTEQSVGVPVQPSNTKKVIQKAMEMFPPVQWYNGIKGREIVATDPNAVKAFNIARRFFDNKIPQLSLNQGADFFEYMKQKGNGNPIVASNDEIFGTKNIYDILIPTLQSSNYPNTRPFKSMGSDSATVIASKINPNISELLNVPNFSTPASILYDEITKTV